MYKRQAIDSALLEAGIVAEEVELPGWDLANDAAITILFLSLIHI